MPLAMALHEVHGAAAQENKESAMETHENTDAPDGIFKPGVSK